MKISELVGKLQETLNQKGDIQVFIKPNPRHYNKIGDHIQFPFSHRTCPRYSELFTEITDYSEYVLEDESILLINSGNDIIVDI